MSDREENRPIKILFVSLDFGPGGAQRQLVNVANGFHEKGYGMSVFAFPNRRDAEVIRGSLHKDIRVFFSSPAAQRLGFFGTFLATVELLRTVLTERPDIIYSRQWPKMPVALMGRITGVKTVAVEGDSIGHTLGKKPLLFLARRFCAQLSDKVVANSKGLAREVKEVFRLSSDVAMIYNGIDVDRIRKKSEEETTHEWFGQDVPVILAIGAHKKQKGFVHLLKSLQIVNRTTPARLIIMGGGNKKELADLAEKFSIADRTDFPDAVPNPFPYIRGADVFACSSIHEGLSNVILEAMALGRPVVSTDHRHGAGEIIEDGRNGILVPPENPQSMAEAILKVLDDTELRERLGAQAKERADDFSKDRMISEYEELFARLQKQKEQQSMTGSGSAFPGETGL